MARLVVTVEGELCADLLDRLTDALEAGFPSENCQGFKKRRRVLPTADGDSDRLKHLSRLYSQLLSGSSESMIQRIVSELRIRQHVAAFLQELSEP